MLVVNGEGGKSVRGIGSKCYFKSSRMNIFIKFFLNLFPIQALIIYIYIAELFHRKRLKESYNKLYLDTRYQLDPSSLGR